LQNDFLEQVEVRVVQTKGTKKWEGFLEPSLA
jgi:hypothetical protein